MSDCIFCKIANGEIPSTLVYEDEHVIAFNDIAPEAPTHLLIVPRKHIPTILEISKEDEDVIMPRIFAVIKHLAKEFCLEQDGFRIVNNCGSNGGQTVNHIHFHMLGGRQLQWPPG